MLGYELYGCLAKKLKFQYCQLLPSSSSSSITSNSVISRSFQDENGREMYQKCKTSCAACSTIAFVHETVLAVGVVLA